MATLALIVAVAALAWAWRLHCRLDALEEERDFEEQKRSLLLD